MSTVDEIESAIEKLPPEEYNELIAWIEEHQAMVGASQALLLSTKMRRGRLYNLFHEDST